MASMKECLVPTLSFFYPRAVKGPFTIAATEQQTGLLEPFSGVEYATLLASSIC